MKEQEVMMMFHDENIAMLTITGSWLMEIFRCQVEDLGLEPPSPAYEPQIDVNDLLAAHDKFRFQEEELYAFSSSSESSSSSVSSLSSSDDDLETQVNPVSTKFCSKYHSDNLISTIHFHPSKLDSSRQGKHYCAVQYIFCLRNTAVNSSASL